MYGVYAYYNVMLMKAFWVRGTPCKALVLNETTCQQDERRHGVGSSSRMAVGPIFNARRSFEGHDQL